MTLPAIFNVPRARPVLELGVGDSQNPAGTAQWQVSHWGVGRWSGTEPLWWEISCEVHKVETFVGHERGTDPWEIATATVTIRNNTGWADFPPTVPDQSPLLSVRPGRQIRLSMVVDETTTHRLWRGYVDRADPGYDPEQGDIVTLECICAKGEAGRASIPAVATAVGANEFVINRINRVLDGAGWPSGRRILQHSAVHLIETTLGQKCADLLDIAADSAGGAVFGNNTGYIEYRPRDWQTYDPIIPVDFTIGNVIDGAGALFIENPPGSGLMEYLGDAGDWVEDPPGSGLMEWAGV